jgi:hypothetical protein
VIEASSVAEQLRAALESSDLSGFSDLLDPAVTWGAPGAARPACRNRGQVMEWYRRGWEAGTRARVTEITLHGDRILVGLMVRNQGVDAERWQVLTVGPAGVSDIVGFEDRAGAQWAMEG